MTVFAACLFALAALASGATIAASVRHYGAAVVMLRAQLASCPETVVLTRKVIERAPVPTLVPLRKRAEHRLPTRLDWGCAVELAA